MIAKQHNTANNYKLQFFYRIVYNILRIFEMSAGVKGAIIRNIRIILKFKNLEKTGGVWYYNILEKWRSLC